MNVESFRYEPDAAGCWIWQGYVDPNGYGRIYNRDRKRIEWAHRYSYEMYKGEIQPRHEIDHTCQTTTCVNPGHLDMVTKSEHVRRTMERLGKDDLHLAAAELRRAGLTYAEIAEALGYTNNTSAHQAVVSAIKKGLIAADEVPPAARLTDDERQAIRDLYTFGIPQPVIAECYSVDDSHVSRIINGRRSRRKGDAA